jgi:hypothetical protein
MNPFSIQLKKLYCPISLLEMKVLIGPGKLDESRIVIKGCPLIRSEETEKA